MTPRPKTITVVATFLFAASALAVITGTSLLFPNKLLDWLSDLNRPARAGFQALGWISGVLLCALGVATGFAGAGLMRRKKWAWWFSVVLLAINGCGDAVGYFITRDLLKSAAGLLVAGTFLFFLSRSSVRRFFHHTA